MSQTLQNYDPHPLAEIFPLVTGRPFEELRDSIKRSGLREEIVLLDGKILDGRNREAACQAAGVAPRYRDFNPAKDGTSPAHFVADKNLHHRHLSPAQCAMAAESFIPFFEAEGANRTQAIEQSAGLFGVSQSSVRTAAALSEKAPEIAAQVKSGAKSLNQGTRDAKKAAADAKQDDESADTSTLRKQHTKEIHRQLGEQFGIAWDQGVILKNPAHLADFIAMEKDDRRLIADLIVKKWEPKVALKFMTRDLDGDSRIKDLVNQFIGKSASKSTLPKIIVDGYVITCRKVVEGAD